MRLKWCRGFKRALGQSTAVHSTKYDRALIDVIFLHILILVQTYAMMIESKSFTHRYLLYRINANTPSRHTLLSFIIEFCGLAERIKHKRYYTLLFKKFLNPFYIYHDFI